MQDFMKDRYGVDDFSLALGGVGVVLTLVGTIFSLQPLSYIALALLALALVRALSKNGAARRQENDAFRRIMARIPGIGARFGGPARTSGRSSARPSGAGGATADFKRQARTAKKMWKDRKTKAFLKCPTCGQTLSVPKGKGKIIVTCPKCHTRMETKS
ncbi:hypothetical protein H6A15_02360 [Enorma phocaeensis]|nr:hypothetical protein [Enorma phocaeensis]